MTKTKVMRQKRPRYVHQHLFGASLCQWRHNFRTSSFTHNFIDRIKLTTTAFTSATTFELSPCSPRNDTGNIRCLATASIHSNGNIPRCQLPATGHGDHDFDGQICCPLWLRGPSWADLGYQDDNLQYARSNAQIEIYSKILERKRTCTMRQPLGARKSCWPCHRAGWTSSNCLLSGLDRRQGTNCWTNFQIQSPTWQHGVSQMRVSACVPMREKLIYWGFIMGEACMCCMCQIVKNQTRQSDWFGFLKAGLGFRIWL